MAGQKTSNQSSWYCAGVTRSPNKTTREPIIRYKHKEVYYNPELGPLSNTQVQWLEESGPEHLQVSIYIGKTTN